MYLWRFFEQLQFVCSCDTTVVNLGAAVNRPLQVLITCEYVALSTFQEFVVT